MICTTDRVAIDMSLQQWLDSLMAEHVLRDLDRPSWQLPSFEEAHGEEWITTFCRWPEDF